MDPAYLPWIAAERFGPAPSIRDDRGEMSFDELDDRVAGVAAQFASLGVGRGDVVAVMLPNRSELVVALFAAWRLGAAATPVNPAFTHDEAEHQVDDSGATLVVNTGPEAPTGGRPSVVVDDLVDRADDQALPAPAPLTAEDLALVIYTSGSTGRPKGVMITHGNVDAMTASMAEAMAITSDDHCLLVLPLFHANALMVSLLTPLRAGAQLTIVGTFSPSRFFDTLERVRPTYFSGVPTIYALLVTEAAERDPDVSSLRFAVCGAAPATRELLRAAEELFGVPLLEGYGLTEATCASAINPLDGPRKAGTVGLALPRQQIKIVDDELREVPAGHAGEGNHVDDGWTHLFPALSGQHLVDTPVADLPPADQAVVAEVADMQQLMSAHERVDSIVTDPAVADSLKPWFGYMCKRPCFNDEYLDTFNRSNVTLAASPTGIDGITEEGIVVAGEHYEVDCIVFATGFETGSGPAGIYGYDVIGRDGLSLQEYFSDGAKTFHGFFTHGFPNFVELGMTQTAYFVNFVYMLDRKSRHSARIIKHLLDNDLGTLEPTLEAQTDWVAEVRRSNEPRMAYWGACTPGYYNGQGDVSKAVFMDV